MAFIQIEIPLSKGKLILTLIGAMIFVVAGFWFLINPIKISHTIWGSQEAMFLLGLVSVLFFGFIAILIVRKLQDKTPGLIINEQGIFDNSSGVSAGLVLWADIKEIKVSQVITQKFIMLIVRNPDEYINRQTTAIKRKEMQLNLSTYGSPINISANALATDFNSLHKLLLQKFEEKKS